MHMLKRDGAKGQEIRGFMAALVLAAGLGMGLGQTGCQGSRGGDTGAMAIDDPALQKLRAETRAIIASARDRVFPSLVNIDVVTLTYQGGKEAKSIQGGSGTIISPDGYVLTNAHVTDEGHKFWCVLSDKQRVPAKLVGEDPWTDLAVLKIDTASLADPKQRLVAAGFGDSDQIKTGDYVMAMGSPFALSRTVTLGIVSNTERVFANFTGETDELGLNAEQRTGLFTTWIQHDALINPGNSGGPLVSLRGEVVGVNTRGGSGMSFATPSNHAKAVAERLIAEGKVERSWIGATIRHIQNTGIERGALVDSVDADGPASRAGLKAGDVLVGMNGVPVNCRFVEEVPPLLRRIADSPVGSPITLDVLRVGQSGPVSAPVSLAFNTELLDRDKGEQVALRTWGITAQRITARMAKWRRLSSTRGVLVSSLRGDGPAAQAEPKLDWGDVVLSIDGTATNDIKALVSKYEQIEAMTDKPEYVVIEFEREGKSFLTLIKPRPEERPDPAPELPKAWVGVATQPVIKNMAEKLGLGEKRGFRVIRVYSGTEAQKAGLKVGDLITGINDERLSPKALNDAGLFNRAIRQLSIDDKVNIKLLRDGKPLELPLVLERTRQTQDEAPRIRNSDFELVVRDITFFDREDYRWDESVKGVIVDSSEMAGWAGLAGIGAGDLIQRIGDFEVTDGKSYKAAMSSISKAQPKRIQFVVYRGSRTYFRFVEPDWKPTMDADQVGEK